MLPLAVAVGGFGATAAAQTYDDLTLVRGRPSPFASVLQLRGGLLGGAAGDEDSTIGLENKLGWDGHAYFHQERFADRDAVLDVYAGRDGAYLGLAEGNLAGDQTVNRIELTARYFPFYREGFYRDGDFVPTGRYEGFDWGAQLTLARMAAEGLRVEFGGFYRNIGFDANADTDPNYTIPDNYNAYGVRVFAEHNTVDLDRYTGRARQGFVFTVLGEREQNDSDARFGTIGVFESKLPSGLWRGRGKLEWYLPQADGATWEVDVQGALTDEKDRVNNYDAQKPQGHMWVDGTLGFRIDLSRVISLRPFGEALWLRILDETGLNTDQETFFGGGLNTRFDFSDSLSLLADYSYLSNESRPPVSTSEDTFGQHRFFLGMEVRFGAQRQ